MKERMLDFYINMARECSKMSRARRLQVGALIVKDNNIISFSWNGTPAGWDNNCENRMSDGTLKTKPETIHAEANAISKLASSSQSGKGASMAITHAPCLDCAKLIYGAGIVEVYYEQEYRDTSGVDFLKKCGISVIKMG